MKQETFHIPTSNVDQANYLIPGTVNQLPKPITMSGFKYNGYITINQKDIPTTLAKAVDFLQYKFDHEDLIEDAYYYYTPDLICQILFLASTNQKFWNRFRPVLWSMIDNYEQEKWDGDHTLMNFSLYFLSNITDTRTLLNSFNYEINHHE